MGNSAAQQFAVKTALILDDDQGLDVARSRQLGQNTHRLNLGIIAIPKAERAKQEMRARIIVETPTFPVRREKRFSRYYIKRLGVRVQPALTQRWGPNSMLSLRQRPEKLASHALDRENAKDAILIRRHNAQYLRHDCSMLRKTEGGGGQKKYGQVFAALQPKRGAAK